MEGHDAGTVPCAYCRRATPPDRQACAPWHWPRRGMVTNCKDCAGVQPDDQPDDDQPDDRPDPAGGGYACGGGHACQGYACPAVHLTDDDARQAVREHMADGWDIVTTTRDAVTLGRLGARLMITTAPRMIEPWE